MKRLSTLAVMWMVLTCAQASSVFAQEAVPPAEAPAAAADEAAESPQTAAARRSFAFLSAAFGAGLIILGAGYGISKIGSTAVESMARQPEVAGNIQTAMIIAAALIEGVTFFGLVVCLLAILL